MPTLTPDQVGSFGEMIAAIDLSRSVKRKYRRALFRAVFLGEKHPVVDYFVEALSADGDAVGFFLAQVRSTSREPRSPTRLNVSIDLADYNRLAGLLMPTYLIGIDVREERSYIVAAAKGRTTGVSSIPAEFDLSDDRVKVKLYEEICAHWQKHGVSNIDSEFHDV